MLKNIVILGDSYSTYEGCIPEGYPTYYSKTGRIEGPSVSKMDKEETWWLRLTKETGDVIVHNNSWSGSTICYTGYDGDCSDSSSFIYRYRQLKRDCFFERNQIDTIIVFGGTNDGWAGAPLGEMQYKDWTEKDLYNVLPAICYLMATLKHNLPNTRIVFIANCDIRTEIIVGMKAAGEYFNVEVIELQEVEKDCGHPTVKGMEQIATQILRKITE